MIKGFRIMVGQLPKSWMDNISEIKTESFGYSTILKDEKINHNSENVDAKATHYCYYTGRLTFTFPEPRHEMSLPEDFIEAAKGIVPGKSNLELLR